MLGIIEIKKETPKGVEQKGGFLSIKFNIENKEDVDLLMDVFWEYMNSFFCGFSDEPKYEHISAITNKEQIIYYDYQTNTINII